MIKCQECEKQGLTPEHFDELGIIETLSYTVPFYDKEGNRHVHDTNRNTVNLRCCNGHRFTQVIPYTCWCGWKQNV